jgi:hypothetical protein
VCTAVEDEEILKPKEILKLGFTALRQAVVSKAEGPRCAWLKVLIVFFAVCVVAETRESMMNTSP